MKDNSELQQFHVEQIHTMFLIEWINIYMA